ncbi:MFS transporter [Hymenobacter sp. BT770]|uniref:MFS transporter n=1 Tax=Hymenobacter sp. BT770 TaxID=2886942 RepID=UPI001D0FF275|nr:MFS transporter [Hymenobacter sp. BT770]MCC3151689.1 MFS transporter [Hymenobacter sp. BT770]MDO3413733.1 MFS transporter [Hymenobacter sp. BT770]
MKESLVENTPLSIPTTSPTTASPTETPAPHLLDNALVWLMAITCGLVVANIYYNQPLLAAIGRTFHLSDSSASLVATATQIGYTLGMLFVVPLGDKLERKRMMLLMLLGAALCMGLAAWAPSFAVLAGASVLIGIFSAVPQLLVPMAAHLAPEASRGRIVGRVMSGLLIGILLSRTVSGYVGLHLGWRAMFEIGAGLMVLLAALLAWKLPTDQPTFTGSYGSLMKSLLTLTREQVPLRRAALVGASLFAAFSVFWTTLAFYLEGAPFHYGSDVAGFFGLIGAFGALAAPLAGKTADTKGPDYTIAMGIVLALVAYAILGFGGLYVAGLVIGVILLDVGVQATHISNQSMIFSLVPEARSRLNTVYMTAYFTGGSLGSILGGLAWVHGGWPGVCAVGGTLTAVALLVSRRYGRA